jgi:hypothetical protein
MKEIHYALVGNNNCDILATSDAPVTTKKENGV